MEITDIYAIIGAFTTLKWAWHLFKFAKRLSALLMRIEQTHCDCCGNEINKNLFNGSGVVEHHQAGTLRLDLCSICFPKYTEFVDDITKAAIERYNAGKSISGWMDQGKRIADRSS